MNNRFEFLVNKDTTFLNFGSFGSCPSEIFEKYQSLQRQLEFQPVEFIVDRSNELFFEARKKLGEYIDCSHEDVVLVTNPSYAVNTVAKSFPLNKGDEILSTNLEYGAIVQTWQTVCLEKEAKFISQNIQFPILDEEHFMDQFWKGFTEKTRAIFISHITSSTALVLPVEKICIEAKKRGLITIVDGAHAPGQLPLSMKSCQYDIYIGACHKWMMSPKGASFLYASKEVQPWMKPLVVSWGSVPGHQQNTRFVDDHQTNGTRDLSALLSVPFCIDFMCKNNWQKEAKSCAQLCLEFAHTLQEVTGFIPCAPLNKTWIGQMFAIPVKLHTDVDVRSILKKEYNIEIPITNLDSNYFIRYSIQAFNDPEDLDNLQTALIELREKKVVSF